MQYIYWEPDVPGIVSGIMSQVAKEQSMAWYLFGEK